MYEINVVQYPDLLVTSYNSNFVPMIGDILIVKKCDKMIVKNRLIATESNNNKVVLVCEYV